jgi:hypothetical protein
VSKRVAVLSEAMAADFGGVAMLSAVDHAMLEQACRLMVRAERTKDADAAVRLSSEARRGLAALRRHRETVPRDEPTLAEVLAARRDAEPNGAAEVW